MFLCHLGCFYRRFMTLWYKRKRDQETSSVSFQMSLVALLGIDIRASHTVASPLTFHSKPVTAMPPAAPVPARPINKPEPSELAKRDAPICASVSAFWVVLLAYKKTPQIKKKEAKTNQRRPKEGILWLHTLTGHQAMSRPAKKYPFRVFLLTLHDD